MAIKTVGVVGCGLMGSGIAQVCAEAGYEVVVREVDDELLKKGLGKIEAFLAKGVEKGKVTAGAQGRGAWAGSTGTTDLAKLAGLRPRHRGRGREPRRQARGVPGPRRGLRAARDLRLQHVVALHHRDGGHHEAADRFVGLHFFNPVPLMKLVEVVRSPLTVARGLRGGGRRSRRAWARRRCARRDKTGFIVNRLLVPYLLDAIRALEEGVGSVADIDEGMQLGCGHPDGAAHAARLRRPRHHLLHRQHHVRRVPREALRAAAAAEADGAGRPPRPQDAARASTTTRRSRRGRSRGWCRPHGLPEPHSSRARDGVAVVTINRPDKLNALNDRTDRASSTRRSRAIGADAARARRHPHRRRREGVRGGRRHRRAGHADARSTGKERSIRGQTRARPHRATSASR